MEELKSKSIIMDTLKTSIINAIKTKKRPDELTVERLTEIGKIKNKPSNKRNSYYLIDDSTDITDF